MPTSATASCNLCGSSRHRTLISADKKISAYPHHVIYTCCNDCSFVSLLVDFEEWEEDVTDGAKGDVLKSMMEKQYSEAGKMIGHQERTVPGISKGGGRKVLDIGSSTGGCLSAYRELGWDVFGEERIG